MTIREARLPAQAQTLQSWPRRRGFTVGRKLAALIAAFALLWCGYAALGYLGREHAAAFSAQVDEAGRLRMYSQKIAYLATRCTSDANPNGCRSQLRQALDGYEAGLQLTAQAHALHLLQADRSAIGAAPEILRDTWEPYGAAARRIADGDADTAAALAYIQAHADTVLADAESLVAVLVSGQQRAQVWREQVQNLLQVAGLILLIIVAGLAYRQGVRPLRQLVELNRRAVQGDYSGRLSYQSGDEVGELVAAFNAANARTETLVWELAEEAAAARRAGIKSAALLESAADGIIITGLSGRIPRVNRQAERIFDYPREQLIGRSVEDLVPSPIRDAHKHYVSGYSRMPTGRPMGRLSRPVYGVRQGGSEIPLEISLSPVELEGEEHIIAVLRDATARLRAGADRRRLIAILDSTPDLVATFTPSGELVYLNPAGRRMAGAGHDDPIEGRLLQDLIAVSSRRLLESEGLPQALGTGFWNGELSLRDHGGRDVPVSVQLIAHPRSEGEPRYLSAVARDISERKRHELELAHRATHDQLTGLANRTLFEDRLEQAIHHARRNGTMIAVMFIDLDNFKLVNDTMGHAVGDVLLCEIARRLESQLRKEDTKARLGGDEFAVILEELARPGDAAQIVRSLSETLRRPIHLHGQEYVETASIGISLYPLDGTTTETLLMHADIAMYQAKSAGRNSYCFYAHGMNVHTEERLEMERDLRHALERDQFELYYQPIVDARSRGIVGCEALLRWHHPEHGLLAPARFITIAEESGLIVPIGQWVLHEAAAQAQAWRRAGLALGHIAVNVSAKQLRHSELLAVVEQALSASGLEPAALELELTEGSILDGGDAAAGEVLDQVRHLGVKLVADDFGTGYSSLSYLKLFRFDKVKIDRGFVRDILSDPGDAAIARAIVAMAHAFDATVVGEGVETPEQARSLQSFGCDQLQGYMFARPLSAEAFATLLKPEQPVWSE